MTSTATWTMFGDDDAQAFFQIVHEGEWLPIWEQPAYSNTIHVPGGNVNVTFLMGLGPLSVTYTVECDTPDDYDDLVALQQTSGTLRIPQTVAEPFGTEVDLSGTIYTEFSDVTLMSISAPQISLPTVSGRPIIQCSATFQREDRE